ncbi:hypothetical protein [Shewanella sp. NIFS-20-20]|uniref:hypothetical protein n=1 Tax=Shewanella sp. NIFS-20-20 TaxID=2853806 RepID=UPI001C47DD5E|nr:hypothetical protein [Shewanella sp. NIFS-20-20]
MSEDNQFFSVACRFNAYLQPWTQPLPDDDALKSLQPSGVQLISQAKAIEASCMLQLRQLEHESKAIIDYLKIQSRKVDLVLQYILEQEIDDSDCFQGSHFGGSGFTVINLSPLQPDSLYRTTLSIREELIAILCIAKVTHCQAIPDMPDHWQIKLDFERILDEDVEQLVQASLRLQQKQLQLRRKQLKQSPN